VGYIIDQVACGTQTRYHEVPIHVEFYECLVWGFNQHVEDAKPCTGKCQKHHQPLVELCLNCWRESKKKGEERKWPGNCQQRQPLAEESPLKEGKASLDLSTGVVTELGVFEDSAKGLDGVVGIGSVAGTGARIRRGCASTLGGVTTRVAIVVLVTLAGFVPANPHRFATMAGACAPFESLGVLSLNLTKVFAVSSESRVIFPRALGPA
jgi:hypothetical protein